jgi:hypothetical protein
MDPATRALTGIAATVAAAAALTSRAFGGPGLPGEHVPPHAPAFDPPSFLSPKLEVPATAPIIAEKLPSRPWTLESRAFSHGAPSPPRPLAPLS